MRVVFGILLLALVLVPPAEAKVSRAGGIGLRFDPSVRDTGLGGAGAAVFWGRDPSDWANPALLGYHDGLLFHVGDTQLVPDLADDVYFRTRRFTLGFWGLGFAAGGNPVGQIRLEMGEQFVTDSGGNQVGTVEPFQDIEAWGVGFSLSAFLTGLTDFVGWSIPWVRLADVAVGYSERRIREDLAPGVDIDPQPVEGRGVSEDIGWLVRLTPIDTLDPVTARLFPDRLQDLGVRLDFAYGSAVQGDNDGVMDFGGGVADPLAHVERTGFAFRLGVGQARYLEQTPLAGIAEWLTPLVAFGYASDTVEESVLLDGVREVEAEPEHSGFEVTLLGVLTMRRGTWEDQADSISGDTSGWSVGLNAPGIGGFRYDRASRPQATGLDDVTRGAWLLHLDVLGIIPRIRSLN